MKKLTFILAGALLLGLAGCGPKETAAPEPANKLEAIQQSGKLTVCTSPDYAPYEFMDISAKEGENIVGADMALAKYIAEGLGVELEIKAMDFDTCLEAVTSGTVDLGISGFSWKEDRAQAALLAGPYCLTSADHQGCLLVRKDADIKTLEDLAGKKLAAQSGSLQHEYMTKNAKGSEQQTIASLADGVMMVSEGKIDALCISEVTGTQYIKNYDNLMLAELRFATEDGYYVLIGKEEQALFDAVQPLVEKAESEGMYEEWLATATEKADSLGIEMD
ncbi:MAG TPA: transporter substrate-binding domain-containing protein [Terriglobales bacterium]|nr:transporter substrate-binding domain-containing protein [Terriglobales bacterium]